MKFLAIFAAILAVSCASPRLHSPQGAPQHIQETTWTLPQLSEALQNPSTDPQLIPFLESGLDALMSNLMSGQQQESIVVAIPATLVPAGVPIVSPTPVVAPTPILMQETTWTLNQLSEALQNPSTDPQLIPFLESGLNALMSDLMSGQDQESIVVAIPATLVPAGIPIAAPTPVVAPEPIRPPTPILTPSPIVNPTPVVVPTPVEAPVETPEASSPLVQIIVNIKQQEVSAPAPVAPAPVEAAVVEEWSPISRPEPEQSVVPTNPIDAIAILPPQPQPINPVDVIAVIPQPIPVNPIDVVAVSPPEVDAAPVMLLPGFQVGPVPAGPIL